MGESSWKRWAFWVGTTVTVVAWSVAAYWTLVAHGLLEGPWSL